jgi:hypothetical protein
VKLGEMGQTVATNADAPDQSRFAAAYRKLIADLLKQYNDT